MANPSRLPPGPGAFPRLTPEILATIASYAATARAPFVMWCPKCEGEALGVEMKAGEVSRCTRHQVPIEVRHLTAEELAKAPIGSGSQVARAHVRMLYDALIRYRFRHGDGLLAEAMGLPTADVPEGGPL